MGVIAVVAVADPKILELVAVVVVVVVVTGVNLATTGVDLLQISRRRSPKRR